MVGILQLQHLQENLGYRATDTDVDGDQIGEVESYVAFVLSVADSSTGLDNLLSPASASIQLQQVTVVSTLVLSIPGGSGGMDVDSEGNIYMADFGSSLGAGSTGGNRVFKVLTDGTFSIWATGLVGASGNDFDAEGNLIQSNIGANIVSKITPQGNVSTLATGLSNPVGVTVAQNGDFYVCNCGNNTIAKVTNNGTSVSTFSSSTLFSCPNGIDMDDSGNLYVANFNNRNLVKITSGGQASTLASLPGNNNGHLLINGNFIYVVSRGLHQIHRVTFSGTVTLFVGNGNREIVDGPALQASLSFPNDIAFSPDGKKMYINDVNAVTDGTTLSPVAIRVVDIAE